MISRLKHINVVPGLQQE